MKLNCTKLKFQRDFVTKLFNEYSLNGLIIGLNKALRFKLSLLGG